MVMISRFSQAAIDENTKADVVETIGNPKYNVAPIPDQAGESARISQSLGSECGSCK
jgi:O-acetylhomoserine/O-acetylserine sulfhydrylase-like pyridoxal-dependent enzyme